MDWIILVAVIYAGTLLYLDIFKWDWLSRHRKSRSIGLYEWIEGKWGSKGVRIIIGIAAVLIIVIGISNFLY